MSHVPIGEDERRRVSKLRQRLALDRLPGSVGSVLLATSTDAQRTALRQLDRTPNDALGIAARDAGRHAMTAGVHEFALLVAGEGTAEPPAAVLLRRLQQIEPETPTGFGTTEVMLTLIGSAVRAQIARHPVLTTHTVALHSCLRRYLDHLRHAVPPQRGAPPVTPDLDVPDDLAPFLYHHLREEFGRQVPRACVTVLMVPRPAAVPAHPGHGVLLVASDHLAFLHPDAFLPPPSPGTTPAATVHAGPVAPHDLVRTYQSAVLLARMIHLGWAAASGPVRSHPHGPGDMSTDLPLGLLEQLTPHLSPLLGLPLTHRLDAAHALHHVLARPSTLQQHARALRVSTATLRHRLAPLESILGRGGLPPDHLIALASLLPALLHLWRAELDDVLGPPAPEVEQVGPAPE